MKKFVPLVIVLIIAAGGCKRVCYSCNQYCAYCVDKRDSAVTYKVCANISTAELKVDSFLRVLQDSNHICNLLKDQTEVCDGKSAIKDGVSYYQKEDYYCTPK